MLSNVNTYSNPSDLRITDMRFVDIDGAPKRCTLIRIDTNQGISGYGEVRDASSKTYALMLKSCILGENPCNVDKIFRKIKQFGGPSRQGGGALELKKIGDIADEHGVAVAIHMAESPVACMAAVQTAAAMHNVLALEFHSVDVPWWKDIVKGLPDPLIKDGFIQVPNKPGLGFDELNEELIREHINKDIPGMWEDTSAWDREFSNDRLWS